MISNQEVVEIMVKAIANEKIQLLQKLTELDRRANALIDKLHAGAGDGEDNSPDLESEVAVLRDALVQEHGCDSDEIPVNMHCDICRVLEHTRETAQKYNDRMQSLGLEKAANAIQTIHVIFDKENAVEDRYFHHICDTFESELRRMALLKRDGKV